MGSYFFSLIIILVPLSKIDDLGLNGSVPRFSVFHTILPLPSLLTILKSGNFFLFL